MPGKSAPFTPSSILFRPRIRGQRTDDGGRTGDRCFLSSVVCHLSSEWWRRRVLPPGPMGLLRRPFIAIAGSRRPREYKVRMAGMKALDDASGLTTPVGAKILGRSRQGSACGFLPQPIRERCVRQPTQIVAVAPEPKRATLLPVDLRIVLAFHGAN